MACRDGVEEPAITSLTFAKYLLCPFAFGNFDDKPFKFRPPAGRVGIRTEFKDAIDYTAVFSTVLVFIGSPASRFSSVTNNYRSFIRNYIDRLFNAVQVNET